MTQNKLSAHSNYIHKSKRHELLFYQIAMLNLGTFLSSLALEEIPGTVVLADTSTRPLWPLIKGYLDFWYKELGCASPNYRFLATGVSSLGRTGVTGLNEKYEKLAKLSTLNVPATMRDFSSDDAWQFFSEKVTEAERWSLEFKIQDYGLVANADCRDVDLIIKYYISRVCPESHFDRRFQRIVDNHILIFDALEQLRKTSPLEIPDIYCPDQTKALTLINTIKEYVLSGKPIAMIRENIEKHINDLQNQVSLINQGAQGKAMTQVDTSIKAMSERLGSIYETTNNPLVEDGTKKILLIDDIVSSGATFQHVLFAAQRAKIPIESFILYSCFSNSDEKKQSLRAPDGRILPITVGFNWEQDIFDYFGGPSWRGTEFSSHYTGVTKELQSATAIARKLPKIGRALRLVMKSLSTDIV